MTNSSGIATEPVLPPSSLSLSFALSLILLLLLLLSLVTSFHPLLFPPTVAYLYSFVPFFLFPYLVLHFPAPHPFSLNALLLIISPPSQS